MTPDDVVRIFLEAYTEGFEDQEELIEDALRISRNRDIARQLCEENGSNLEELLIKDIKSISYTESDPKVE